MTTRRDAIDAALRLAEDFSTGKVDPDDLDAELVKRCRDLVGQVVGSGDLLWPLQIEIARGVLAAGGLDADELSEWAAVARRRATELPPTDARPDAADGPESAVTEPYSPENPEDSE